jgi:hypothetical protein
MERWFPAAPQEYTPEPHGPSFGWLRTLSLLVSGFVVLLLLGLAFVSLKPSKTAIEAAQSTPVQETPRWGDPTPTPTIVSAAASEVHEARWDASTGHYVDPMATPEQERTPAPTPSATPVHKHKHHKVN